MIPGSNHSLICYQGFLGVEFMCYCLCEENEISENMSNKLKTFVTCACVEHMM